jgi:hypothetical protein
VRMEGLGQQKNPMTSSRIHGCSMNLLMKSFSDRGVIASCTELVEGYPEEKKGCYM